VVDNEATAWLHPQKLKRFDQCWVPDYALESASLSGALCHGKGAPMPITFIGPQSRFELLPKTDRRYTKVILLSCPEPLRTAWEKHLIATMQNAPEKMALITHGANAAGSEQKQIGAIDVFYGLADEAIAATIACGQEIICNAGYSTLMDMHAMGIRPFVFATPGQTEQEYLVRYLYQKNKVDIAARQFLPS
jgi:hypothetical protein